MVLQKIFILAVFVTSSYCQSGETCTTPDNRQGNCISINECSPLVSLLTQTRPVLQAVLDFHCGFKGNNFCVCCPMQTTVITTQATEISQPSVEAPPDVSNHPNLRLLPLNICGPHTHNKMFNGRKTSLFEYPWMALIGYNLAGSNRRVHRCGGTIISEKYVLTAAHCLTSLPSSLTLASVRLGEYDLQTDIDCMEDENGDEACADPPIDFGIEDVITHPSYSRTTFQNDIGLVRIRGTANFKSDSIKPICVPIGKDQMRNLDGEKLLVNGWRTTEEGTNSTVLLKSTIPVVPLGTCAAMYSRTTLTGSTSPVQITSHQICAGGENSEDSCNGDSGGPLIFNGEVNSRLRFVQYGVVSFGPRSCGIKDFPAVYTRVADYVDWILNNMKP